MRFCLDITFLFHFWDQVYHGTRKRTKEEFKDTIRVAFELTANPFFVYHMSQLRPLLVNVILCWEDSNALSKNDSSGFDKFVGFGLRNGILNIFSYCAYLIGGIEWFRSVSPEIRKTCKESLDFYEEFVKCQIQS